MDFDTINGADASDFKLGDWWVRPQRNALERTGEVAHVEARSMAVLVCLGHHAPGVVSKERFLEEVWSDSPYVGDDVIGHAIWELRKALGDSARDPVYIQTVPRKGYRLIAEILRPQGSPLPMEGVRIQNYDLQEELGRGSMGVVYQAVDRTLGRTVAIKFLAPELSRDPKAGQRFQREARLAASLDHPNLATVHEIGETSQGYRFLVNAYYSGGSLKDRLAEGPIAVDEALSLVRQLVAGLAAAHQRGIVHRDIKPANLLLDEHGTLKICDFGIAKLIGATDLTRTGAPLGTPAYKSPEQTQGRAVDHRTDLWSVGVVFFELLTGRRPFDGEYEHAVVHSILSREPRTLEEAGGHPVPEPLRRFASRALAKEPADRFQSAEEMAAALDQLDKEPPQPLPPGGSRRFTAVVTGTLVVLLAVLGVLIYRQHGSPASGVPPSATISRADMESQEGLDHLAQGRALWPRGNHPANLRQVRDHFEKAVELLPDSVEAEEHLAAFLAERYTVDKREEDRAGARKFAQKALETNPQSALARTAKAWILLWDGKVSEGEQLAREALGIEPTCERGQSCDLAYLCLAEALWVQGRGEEALAALNKGILVGDGHIRCRLKRAQYYEKLGEKKKAEDDYLQVLEWDDVQTTALNELSKFLLTAGRATEAVPLLRRLHDQTQDPKTLISLGYALYLRELWDEAIGVYYQAHEGFEDADSSVPTPLMAIGDIYLEQGRLEKAVVLYKQALEMFDSLVDSANPGVTRQAQRAVCLAKLGRLDEAEEEIQRHFDRVEENPDILFYAARIYALKRDRNKLLQLARQWKETDRGASRFLDDPAFIPYRTDRDYIKILEPELIPDD